MIEIRKYILILLLILPACSYGIRTEIIHSSIKPSSSILSSPSIISSSPVQTIAPAAAVMTTSPVESIVNTEQPIHGYDFFTKSDVIKNNTGYNGKVLIIIDTYLEQPNIRLYPSEDNRTLDIGNTELRKIKYPRKVMVFKESYDELSNEEKINLKHEYADFTIFDLDKTYNGINIVDGMLDVGGRLILDAVINNRFNIEYFTYVSYEPRDKLSYEEKYKYNLIFQNYDYRYTAQVSPVYPYFQLLTFPLSNSLFNLYKNIKNSNKNKLTKLPIQKIVFSSMWSASVISDFFDLLVHYFNILSSLSIQIADIQYDFYPTVDWVIDVGKYTLIDERFYHANNNGISPLLPSRPSPTPSATLIK
ncbi:MAG: hypothetical protein H7263_16460 [Candidatus Sericytochromatia bacterium]|nr:hypothetical protein [Candidatus Sericytochromatia bacterium]